MATNSVHLTVTVERAAAGVFTVTNSRGGQITFGKASGADFTPSELLLAAIGGRTVELATPITDRIE
jgi:putative redox protein